MAYVATLQAGVALARLGDGAGAEEALAAAVGFDPARAEARVALSKLLALQGRHDDALAAAAAAAALPPPLRAFYHDPSAYACDAPLAAAAAAAAVPGAAGRAAAFRAAAAAAGCGDAAETPPEPEPEPEPEPPRPEPDPAAACGAAAAGPLRAAAVLWRHGAAAAAYASLKLARPPRPPLPRAARARPARAQAAGAPGPRCCGPYREFSRLFLGEAPPFLALNASSQRDLLAALDADVGARGDAGWAALVAYGAAALRRRAGDVSGAAAALRRVVAARRRPARGRLGPRAEGPPLVAAAATDDGHPGLAALRASAARANASVAVLGLGEAYAGHEAKLRLYRAFVAEVAANEPRRLVLLVDGYDVVLWPALGDLERRVAASGADVLLGRDAACYPDVALDALYEDRDFANSGTIAGAAAAVLAVLDAVFAYGAPTTCGPDDQRAFHRALLEGVAGVALAVDARGNAFHTLHGEVRDLAVDAAGQLVVAGAAGDAARPVASHGNAGDGKAILGRVAAAAAGPLPAAVEPAHFARGIALFAAGRARDAADAFRAHVAGPGCAADHAADAYYNLGVALGGDLGAYEAALGCDDAHALAAQNAGVAALAAGDAARAVAFFERAAAADPAGEDHAANLAAARRRLPGGADAGAPLGAVRTRELSVV